MYTQRVFKVTAIIAFTLKMLIVLGIWSSIVVILYKEVGLHWIKIPWIPLSLIGTAVAFYLGFKNNSAYERTWEARKIWGAIVNDSRTWGIMSRDFITEDFAKQSLSLIHI